MPCKYCKEALKKIDEKYPNSDWNLDEACEMWNKLSDKIPYNKDIKFEDGSDEIYGCTCPNCGELICCWCV